MLREILVLSLHFYVRWHLISTHGGECCKVPLDPVNLRRGIVGKQQFPNVDRLKRVVIKQQYTSFMEFADG
jgi:hypothetical protein